MNRVFKTLIFFFFFLTASNVIHPDYYHVHPDRRQSVKCRTVFLSVSESHQFLHFKWNL